MGSGLRAESVSDGCGALGDRRLAVRGLVGVDDALAHGLVELAACLASQFLGLGGLAGVSGLAEAADVRLQGGLHSLVAQARLLVGAIALDLRLDVRHWCAFASRMIVTPPTPAGPRTKGTGDPPGTQIALGGAPCRDAARPDAPCEDSPVLPPQPGRTDPAVIRNFCIIAHIDHGKSTLADRMLQATGVVDDRQMRAQYLDRMDIERERGITIKSQAVRLPYRAQDGQDYVLNLIDTPGHVDFTYEVSRSLAACEGAVLLVDAAQGIEAQTLANLYLALENDLQIIPVLNKIDLPAAQPEKYAAELAHIIGCSPDDVLKVSAKTGEGVAELLEEIVRTVPHPIGNADAPVRALIFDSVYDTYRGVVTYVRVIDGHVSTRERIEMMSTHAIHDLLEIGVISPEPVVAKGLGVGEVGYLITGVKDVRQSRVGDTVTLANKGATQALGGYRDPKPMVFSGLYPIDGSDYPALRDALDKLKLNDAALVYEPETSVALGFGFRCGFLGLLHLEIVRERLEREFNLDLISTAPNVVYRVIKDDGAEVIVTNPSEFPTGKVAEVHEPVVRSTILAPSDFVGTIMELCQARRGVLLGMDYLSQDRVELRYTLPLAEIVFDFFDQLKSRTKGYASLDYETSGEQAADLVKVDILLHGDTVDAFSAIVHKDKAYAYGVAMTAKLRELIPRQQFEVPIQAAIGSRVIARETVRAIRKDVLAKCYGGDITRKRKLLEKQKEGKKRMKMVGRVEVPQEAFIAALSTSDEPAKK
jgi:GTP-binding protein LepA